MSGCTNPVAHVLRRRTAVLQRLASGFVPIRKNNVSDCLHCDIHDLMESHLQSEEANLAEIAAKVTEVLADLILLAPAGERGTLIADVLVNLGEFVLQKGENGTGEPSPRRH
jgi:hypothetical protein